MSHALARHSRLLRRGFTVTIMLFYLGYMQEYASMREVPTAPVRASSKADSARLKRKAVSKTSLSKAAVQYNDKLVQHRKNITFDWEDVDTTTAGMCGGFKCFFLSRSDPQSHGYLIVPEKPNKNLIEGQRSRLLGEELQQRFPALKILTPWNIEQHELSDEMAKRLNSILFSIKTDSNMTDHTLFSSGTVVTYTAPTAPTPNYQVKHGNLHANKIADRVKEYARQQDPSRLNMTLWMEHFRASVELLPVLVTAEPCLGKDFQVLLEISTGHMWHFDLDRCFEGHEDKLGKAKVMKLFYYKKGLKKYLENVAPWAKNMEKAFRKIKML